MEDILQGILVPALTVIANMCTLLEAKQRLAA
jgi:hypothetical protein